VQEEEDRQGAAEDPDGIEEGEPVTSFEARRILLKLLMWLKDYGGTGPVSLSSDEIEAIKVLVKGEKEC
jgi:hypothetical protein